MEEPLARWTVLRWVRVLYGVSAAIFAVLGGAWAALTSSSTSSLVVSLVMVVVPSVVLCLSITGYVALYPDRVVLGGFLRRHRELPLADLQAVEPSPFGLHFRTGPTTGAYAPRALGTHGGSIAAAVMAQARAGA